MCVYVCAILPFISPRMQSRSMQLNARKLLHTSAQRFIGSKTADRIVFYSSFFFFPVMENTRTQRRVMKIRCGKRCGGRRSIIAAKFQPFASETLAKLHMPLLFIVYNNNKTENWTHARLKFCVATEREFCDTI